MAPREFLPRPGSASFPGGCPCPSRIWATQLPRRRSCAARRISVHSGSSTRIIPTASLPPPARHGSWPCSGVTACSHPSCPFCWTPSLALGTLQTLADHQGKEVNPSRKRTRAGSSTKCDWVPVPSPSWVAAASTTEPPMPPHCSSPSSASWAGGGWKRTQSTPCCQPQTGRWPGSRTTVTATVTDSSNTSGKLNTG